MSAIGFPIGLSVSGSVFVVVEIYVYCFLFSITDKSASAAAEWAAFELQSIRSQTGIHAEGAMA